MVAQKLAHCVATHLRCDGIFDDNIITNFFSLDSNSEICLKIGKYSMKIRRAKNVQFFGQSCIILPE